MSDFEIRVGSVPAHSFTDLESFALCTHHAGSMMTGVRHEIRCDVQQRGSYVAIRKTGDATKLHFCNVEVNNAGIWFVVTSRMLHISFAVYATNIQAVQLRAIISIMSRPTSIRLQCCRSYTNRAPETSTAPRRTRSVCQSTPSSAA